MDVLCSSSRLINQQDVQERLTTRITLIFVAAVYMRSTRRRLLEATNIID